MYQEAMICSWLLRKMQQTFVNTCTCNVCTYKNVLQRKYRTLNN